MFGIKPIAAVVLAAASVLAPSLASAQQRPYYPPPPVPQASSQPDLQAVEQLAGQIQRDRYTLDQARSRGDWNQVRIERDQIARREARLADMLRSSCGGY